MEKFISEELSRKETRKSDQAGGDLVRAEPRHQKVYE